jgi:hypothetical protein
MLLPTNLLKLPDPWQHEAVNLLRAGRDVVVSAPTGAGKTFIFELIHKSGSLKGQAVYTVPTRALANDKYAEWRHANWDVGIATGDLAENTGAPVVVATLETQVERLVRGEGPALLVIDEYQMIADASRGSHYEAAIALAPPPTRLLLLSGSVANPEDIADWLRHLDRPASVVITRERPVPLDEAAFETLPRHLERRFENRWSKLAVAALTAGLAPLLVFAPRRKDAESIARRLAADLPPGTPLELTAAQRGICGRELSQMLERRVAFHHSGLSYAARAGVIEPLAKAGQLRVVAATLGLAAGINFSVRSVHVAAAGFFDGRADHRLASDELLQMFGRAGRRGLDDRGYVITTRDSPGLPDARPARLHRGSVLAWPVFLRVMRHAASAARDPFASAEEFASRLYAKSPPPLGLEDSGSWDNLPSAARPATSALFGLEAVEKQILNTSGQWERRSGYPARPVSLGEAWIATPERVLPALSWGPFAGRFAEGLGRVLRMPKTDESPPDATRYGLELPLGVVAGDGASFRPTKRLRKLLKLPRRVEFLQLTELEAAHLPALRAAITAQAPGLQISGEAELVEFSERDGVAHACFDLSTLRAPAVEDSLGRAIIDPVERTLTRREGAPAAPTEESNPARRQPRPGSPIHTWLQLGLIDQEGVPTRRGEVFSFFQGGEGLAIAAALEDETYPVEDLAAHLANLRAGIRFDPPEIPPSERIGAACRAAYGFTNHHGYLEHGLPLDYGEGAAEVIDAMLSPRRGPGPDWTRGLAEGDLSRACVEWISLLRHIHHAPDHAWPRWMALKKAAENLLSHHKHATREIFHLDLPPLTNRQRAAPPPHALAL